MRHKSLKERLQERGPRRLLALDGGGIRGLITIEVLKKIEDQLRESEHADSDFVLADYFDYIAGTSTGAIIATLLSLGLSVSAIRDFYVEHGAAMFRWSLWRLYRSLYSARDLSVTLRDVIGSETPLGTERLRTLLLLVMRNADTDSPWFISNNDRAKYNQRGIDGCNLDLPLWRLVRASTAAPTFFEPEAIRVGSREFRFVDGGITTYNNPAFLLFLMATIEPYKLSWPVGPERLLLVSVGTGTHPRFGVPGNLITELKGMALNLVFAALNEQDVLCRAFGRCLCGAEIDSEIGDLTDPGATSFSTLFTYVRYNAELTESGLKRLGLRDIKPGNVEKMDSVKHITELQRVGRAVAAQVQASHFLGFELEGSPVPRA